MNRYMLACITATMVLFSVVSYFHLTQPEQALPSPLLNQPLPAFNLPTLNSDKLINREMIKGHTTLLNIWASWCLACREEVTLLLKLQANNDIQIIGVNYKDERGDARNWLRKYGDPFNFSILDYSGQLALDLGVYGVPETYLLDSHAIIRKKWVGIINEAMWHNEILPMIQQLEHE